MPRSTGGVIQRISDSTGVSLVPNGYGSPDLVFQAFKRWYVTGYRESTLLLQEDAYRYTVGAAFYRWLDKQLDRWLQADTGADLFTHRLKQSLPEHLPRFHRWLEESQPLVGTTPLVSFEAASTLDHASFSPPPKEFLDDQVAISAINPNYGHPAAVLALFKRWFVTGYRASTLTLNLDQLRNILDSFYRWLGKRHAAWQKAQPSSDPQDLGRFYAWMAASPLHAGELPLVPTSIVEALDHLVRPPAIESIDEELPDDSLDEELPDAKETRQTINNLGDVLYDESQDSDFEPDEPFNPLRGSRAYKVDPQDAGKSGTIEQFPPTNLKFKPEKKSAHLYGDIGKGGFRQRKKESGPVQIELENVFSARYGLIKRPIHVHGFVEPNQTTGRPNAPEPVSGVRVSESEKGAPKLGTLGEHSRNTGYPDVQKGHIYALELGGPDIPQNIVPQWAMWQGNGAWRKMEVVVHDKAVEAIQQGKKLHFDVTVRYKTYKELKNATLEGIGFPTGFRAVVTEYVQQQDGTWVAGSSAVVWDDEQAQDKTDDKIFLRTLQKLYPDEVEGYSDWNPKGDKGKGDWF